MLARGPSLFHTEHGIVEFRNRFALAFLANVLLCLPAGWAQNRASTRITVFVNDSIGVKSPLLMQGEAEASRLFRGAGVHIDWKNCADTPDCRRPPDRNEFVLHIVSKGTTRSDIVFGEAFLGPDGSGKYADVFFNRLLQAGGDVDTGQLFGAVSAHELGHLLLGSHSHSLIGIMEPVWHRESLHKIAMGSLTFTPDQEKLIRSRLLNERVAVTSLRGPGRLGLE